MAQIDKSLLVEEEAQMVPVLPLRDVVVFPFMVIPLFVGRAKSIRALEEAMSGEKQILLVAQKNAADDDPQPENIYRIGTLATILQLLKLPDGTVKVLVEGTDRAKIVSFLPAGESLRAQVQVVASGAASDRELEALMRSVSAQFESYVKLNKKIPPEILSTLASMDDPARLADTVAAHLSLKLEEKQEILEKAETQARLEHLLGMMESEIDLLQVEKRIRGRVKRQMEKSQREYYLNEQMKAIQKELGDLSEEGGGELDDLARKIGKAGMPKDVQAKAEAELKKLRMMSPMSAEATVVRNYIDWLVSVPWRKRSKITKDLKRAKAILDADHYGLEDVKERILEYLAVQERVGNSRGPILCLVGPPGVGKTSLGRSIASATGRKFVRMSLGGVRDEAEIRGHRRTYIGALPGKIVQSLAKIATRNPLMLLDEVDKMAMDFRGDPASALLEVLDPEQNATFNDHYLEVDFNLSEVMFVTTANTLNIPAPLMDRMEVIRIPGYTEDEKTHIATQYLLPKQIGKAGLKDGEIQVSQTVIRDIIRYYTREAGVRNLERELARICRKVVKELLLDKKRTRVQISDRNLNKYLGVRRFDFGKAEKENRIGEVTGLAWTEVGGELLSIEAVVVPGRGKLLITGKLGDVMQESIQAAMSVVRARSRALGIAMDFYQNRDVHIHVPEGATPKDGPSAGIGMATALVSALTNIPVHATVAMTGEITLRGEVLPIGGLKEKLLAAHRGGISTVLIPAENEKDLQEIPKNVRDALTIKPVRWIDEVLAIALESAPTLLPDDGESSPLIGAVPVNEPVEDKATAH
ncbi:endopeptidase La [Acidithiobacillus ferrianus]|uniref:Endopeptidase La n=1 Tax=Acidithiobacillus ferrianus TaxID=2678518 RepID=A0ACD5H6Z5_9PROT